MPRILIGALSGWAYAERRQRCLSTWFADAYELQTPAFFLLGCETCKHPEQLGPHRLALPCPDDYPSLPQRTRWFCQWALNLPSPSAGREGWDYLFKCDDDTYVSIPRLLAYDTAGRDYIGAEWKPGVNYASGGAGYFLSRRAAQIVAQRLTATIGAEDLLVGRILRAAGISLSIEPRLVPFASMEHRPRRDNELITLHASTEAWQPSHGETGLR